MCSRISFQGQAENYLWSVGLSLLVVVSILFAVGIIHSAEWLEVNFVCSAIYIICAEALNKSAKGKKKSKPQTSIEKLRKRMLHSMKNFRMAYI